MASNWWNAAFGRYHGHLDLLRREARILELRAQPSSTRSVAPVSGCALGAFGGFLRRQREGSERSGACCASLQRPRPGDHWPTELTLALQFASEGTLVEASMAPSSRAGLTPAGDR